MHYAAFTSWGITVTDSYSSKTRTWRNAHKIMVSGGWHRSVHVTKSPFFFLRTLKTLEGNALKCQLWFSLITSEVYAILFYLFLSPFCISEYYNIYDFL